MNDFANFHPSAVFVYYLCVLGVTMCSASPLITALSLFGALALCFALRCLGVRRAVFAAAAVAATAVINPLVYHNGETVLIVINDSPVTLEALLYGVNAGAAIAAALLWCWSFSAAMTSDRLMCVFGAVSPRTALTFSMALRYIPRFRDQLGRVAAAQKGLGLYRTDNLPDDIRSGARVFTAVTGWALENGVVTADSMEARGYGAGKRGSFSLWRFRASDAALTALSLALTGVCITGLAAGWLKFEFYPALTYNFAGAGSVCFAAAFAALAAIPAAIETAVNLKWRYLRSKT